MTDSPASAPAFRSAFRHRSFALFWSARLGSWLAEQMQAVAVGWQMYELTGDPLDLGLVGLFQFLPTLALSLVAGHVVDSHDRRRILAAALALQTVAVGVLFALTAAGAASPGLIFAVVFAIGLAKAFAGPALSALISAVVPAEDLPNAVAWNSTAMQTATIGGPALGGCSTWAVRRWCTASGRCCWPAPWRWCWRCGRGRWNCRRAACRGSRCSPG